VATGGRHHPPYAPAFCASKLNFENSVKAKLTSSAAGNGAWPRPNRARTAEEGMLLSWAIIRQNSG
jgi:hypothetical protein